MVKTIGLGLASAILIDVLVVRMVVAPAVMALLGDRAWVLPARLDRVLPRISRRRGAAGRAAATRLDARTLARVMRVAVLGAGTSAPRMSASPIPSGTAL